MTPGVRVHVVMPPGLLERVDSARGEGQSRGDFVRRAVERALSADPIGGSAVDRQEPQGSAASLSAPAARSAAPAEQPALPAPPVWRVSPSGPTSPRVPFRRDVKPFQRGGS